MYRHIYVGKIYSYFNKNVMSICFDLTYKLIIYFIIKYG